MVLTFEQFREEQFRKNPELRRSSEALLRRMYSEAVGHEAASAADAAEARRIDAILVTTASAPG